MTDEDDAAATQAALAVAQAQGNRTARMSVLVGLGVIPVFSVVAMLVAERITNGPVRVVLVPVFVFTLLVPFQVIIKRFNGAQRQNTNRVIARLTSQLSRAVDLAQDQVQRRELAGQRREFESRLANALDMADGEPEVIDVIERSLSVTLPQSPAELLLADNSHAHLTRMASVSPTAPSTGCEVGSPSCCPAARRAQTQRFTHSDHLDACPKLRGRPEGAVSAVCVPVSITGRTVGVIHATAGPDVGFPDDAVLDLGTLAKLAGARIGLLRVMAETELQAATDSLTGLLNRRSFEQQVTGLRRQTALLSLGMADLDHFKEVNDTYGHETGDRALRLFAQVLAGSVRAQDLVGRHGGEEFVIALAGCTAESARTVLNSVRDRLDAARTVAGLPTFTVSFGLVEALDQEDLPSLIGRADGALFQAKREGRDRVTVRDAFGATVPAPTDDEGQHPSNGIHSREGDDIALAVSPRSAT